jgi:signal transduction histidine kinase
MAMFLTFERKLPIILFFVFLMLTTVGVVFYLTTTSLQAAINRQKRSQAVISRVDDTVAASFEIQMALNSFLLVGNTTYLDPLDPARQRVRANLEILRSLTNESSTQLSEVNRIDQILKEYNAEVSRKIDLRKMQGSAIDPSELPWRDGQKMLEQVRKAGESVKRTEVSAQEAFDLNSDFGLAVTVWILIVSSLAGIISLGVANLTVLSEIKKRRVAQNDLMELNEGLELSIEERTLELKRANEKLLEVGLERESILYSEKEARKEAEIANRLRDEFMATVSHELRTPLNSILGWARMMKGGSLDNAQVEKALTTIIKNSETQTRLIEDLLDVARVISGKLQLKIVDLSIADVISEAIETVRPAANNKDIKIDLDVDPAAHDAVTKGDYHRMVQVFTNLLGNAVKFSQEGAAIDVDLRLDGANVKIGIHDQGKGIDPEFLPLVFDRFRQDSSPGSRNGGLGLGLAIVRNLVEMHHGTVMAESEGENKGSKFTVLLPLKTDDEPLGLQS